MSEDNNTGAPEATAPEAPAAPEYASKTEIEGIKSQFADQNAKLEQILQMVNERTAQRVQEPQEPQKIGSLLFDDADKAAQIIEDRAVRRAQEQVNKQLQLSQAAQQAVGEIAGRYPEFAQPGSEAGTMAIQRANNLPAHLKGTPEGARMVMLEVASELGLLPVNKRKQATSQQAADDFAIGGQAAPSKRGAADPTKGIDPKTLAFAELLDPSIKSDPKRLEALKNASQRETYTKYR